MIATHDPIDVRAYGRLANRLLYDSVKSLQWVVTTLNRATATVFSLTAETPPLRMFWAQYRIHEARSRLCEEISFLDSGLFDNLCGALDIDSERAYSALQARYASKCRKALELADKADQICAEYFKKS